MGIKSESCFQIYFINPFDLSLMARPKMVVLVTIIPIISWLTFFSVEKNSKHRISAFIRGSVTILSFGVLTLFLDLIVFLGKKFYSYFFEDSHPKSVPI